MTDTSSTLTTVQDVLRLIEEGEPPGDAALSRALDRLAMAWQDCPPGNLADDDEPPPREGNPDLNGAIGKRFPDYGYYSAADPFAVPDDAPGIMDAIDDLAEIVVDLRDILWRRERFGEDDAHYHFRQSFEIHLGGHVRSLSGYLHARQFGWP